MTPRLERSADVARGDRPRRHRAADSREPPVHHLNTISFYIETGRLQPPETRVHSLLYVSTPCALPSPAEMARIIAVAHANNSRESISGLLLRSDASFAQVLEGPGGGGGRDVRAHPARRPTP
jgi:hypothetical protein